MITLPLFIIAATSAFLVGLLLQSITKLKFCAVCVVISGSWLALLALRLVGFIIEPALIGVLMGESVVGLFYLLEKKVPEPWQIFRWPYLMTMTVVVYMVVGVRKGAGLAVLFLAALWFIYGVIFIFRKYPVIKKIAERVIACCRDW